MDAAATMQAVHSYQSALYVLTALKLYDYKFPVEAPVSDGACYDYIIVGGGSAGCVLANRLTKDKKVHVLLIEAGGYPSIEAFFPGGFYLQPNSYADWNFTCENDGYSAQNLQRKVLWAPAGKMLGGSSSLHHMMHTHSHPRDYYEWSVAANDSSWGYAEILQYYIKSERLEDPVILNSPYKYFHGTDGYLRLTRQLSNETADIYNALAEIGHNFTLDYNDNSTLGVADLIYNIADGVRQNNALAYLGPIKKRSNLHLMLNTQVIKINFGSDNTAESVKALTNSNKLITIKAKKEIIVSAGVFNTPKLLMLSGVGPKDHLKSLNIPLISDLPVGSNFQHHPTTFIEYKIKESNDTIPPINPNKFPVPALIDTVALNGTIPDYQAIHLIFPHDSITLLTYCTTTSKYTDKLCQAFYDASKDRQVLISLIYKLKPKSRGRVLLRSTNPSDKPLIYSGTFSNHEDLKDMVSYLKEFVRIGKSKYFASVGAELVILDLPKCANFTLWSDEYWECYALEMSNTVLFFCGTAALGSVVNNRLQVFGVQRLRVVDASVMPTIASGKLNGPVTAIAEKAADMIKADSMLLSALPCEHDQSCKCKQKI